MTERKVENSLDRKLLIGIALMLSIAVAFVVFVKEVLPTLGFPFVESIVIAVVCYIISLLILYKVVVWVEKT
jgi:membrane protein YdbS with pleckstrin-like domain